MNTLTATMILLLSWTQVAPRPVATPAGRPAVPVQNRPPQPVSTAPVAPHPMATERQMLADLQVQGELMRQSLGRDGPLGDEGLWGQACQTVLVVPTPELMGRRAETGNTDNSQAPTAVDGDGATRMAQITEDMTVMCRILDKVAAPMQSQSHPVSMSRMPRLYGTEDSRTQGLYLAGYGALFFVRVDFPLRPPRQEQPQPQGEATADPVWAQTVEELRGAPAEGQPAIPARAYDPQQVENFKATLIKSLRQAANLRLASAQDVITFVVGPEDSQTRIYPDSDGYRVIAPSRGRGRSILRAGVGSVSSAPADLASVLILRVSKADVDAFARGEIPMGTFTEKVQTLWSWANGGPTEAPTTVQYERYPENTYRAR